jgi:hypothetical protein
MALAQYTLLEMLDVFSLYTVVEKSVAPTNRSQVFPPTYCQHHLASPQTRSPPTGLAMKKKRDDDGYILKRSSVCP